MRAFLIGHNSSAGRGHMGDGAISVIIPAYNCAKTLLRAVKSCITQLEMLCDVVIVDDCSEDDTPWLADDLSTRYQGLIKTIHNSRRLNSFESRKVGLNHSQGEYIVFLDADDELDESSLSNTLQMLIEQSADIAAYSIVPVYAEGRTPSYDVCTARQKMYSAPDLTLSHEQITHAIFSNHKIVWSLVGKMFSRRLLERAFELLPSIDLFQADDACAMFVISTLATKMVSNSTLPPYRYYMGIGGTVVDKPISAKEFSTICQNIKAAEVVFEYLNRNDLLNDFFLDYCSLRKSLCADPATRYPNSVISSDRIAAFEEYISLWPIDEVVSSLAATHWDSAHEVLLSLQNLKPPVANDNNSGDQTIAVIYHSLGIGGIENVIRFECSCWTHLGYRVVLLIDEGQELIDLPESIELVRLPDCFQSYRDAYTMRAKALCEALVRFEVKTLVHHQWLGLTLPWDLLIARCLGIHCLTQVHGVWFSAFGYDLEDLVQLPLSYCINDGIVCLSDVDAEFWRIFCSNVYVTQNPTSSLFYNAVHRQHNDKNVVWCGRLDVDKGLDDALIAIKEAIRLVPDATFKLIGPYTDQVKQHLEELLDKLQLPHENVLFCGAKTESELVEEYETADVYFLSSHMEGWSLSLAEAKAAGLPCVMYDLPYLKLCKPDSGVLTAKLGDATGLGRQIARLLSDDQLRKMTALSAKKQSLQLQNYSFSSFWSTVFQARSCEAPSHVGCSDIDERNVILWESYFEVVQRKICEKKAAELEVSQLRIEKTELSGKIERINSLFPVKAYRRAMRLFKPICFKIKKIVSIWIR